MTVNEAKFLCKKIMQAGEVPLLVGHFGVGKTDIARQIAAENGRKIIILVLSQMEPGDLIGLPARQEDRTTFLRPDWWPEDGNCLIVLDEINRAHRSIRNAIMQLLIDKRIHNHVLPDGVWIMATMNPPDEEYDQADLITDPAFISRFFVLHVNPTVDEWKEWAQINGVDPKVIDFIASYPEFLYTSSPLSLRVELRPSPRSWYKLSNVLRLLSKNEIEKYAYILASAIVGAEAAKAFVEFKKSDHVPMPRKILLEGLEASYRDDVDRSNSLVVRLIDYFSKLNDEEIELLSAHISRVAQNLDKLASVLPRDSFYALVRFIVDRANQDENSSQFFERLLERLSNLDNTKTALRDL
ncbi:MAG: MoxR family ATPase [Pseudothermotoga sp.]|uniref:MoxR family ATPase n=1 Tax=Pseudothermotoga sp. TaxID=2033661 RepID=UPI000B108AED|nr:MoxR family ATPase [Pseudothermotoga sp.]HBT40043.1 MoxR family ATPase [Pseudothermotoga sp.]HCO98414.1 MoxR family ATPase [Pseudothermotoga sp.]